MAKSNFWQTHHADRKVLNSRAYRPTKIQNIVEAYRIVTRDLLTGSLVDNVGPILVQQSLIDSKVSQPNPKWRDQVRKGENATTPFSGTKYTYECFKRGYVHSVHAASSATMPIPRFDCRLEGVYVFGIGNPLQAAHSDMQGIDAKAISRYYSKIKQIRQQISGPTFLGELAESIGMIRRPASGIIKSAGKYLDSLGKVQKTSLARYKTRARQTKYLLDAAANLILEVNFGWKPLINDCKDIAISVARTILEIRHRVVRGYDEGNQTILINHSISPVSNDLNVDSVQARNVNYRSLYRGAVKAFADGPLGPARSIVELSGFNLREFVPTLWELLPWSFLVDYFLNIGDLLEANLTDTSQIAWTTHTTVNSTSYETLQRVVSRYPDRLISMTGNSCFGETRVASSVVSRANSPTAPSLPLTFSWPGKKSQFANMISLLITRSHGFRPNG